METYNEVNRIYSSQVVQLREIYFLGFRTNADKVTFCRISYVLFRVPEI